MEDEHCMSKELVAPIVENLCDTAYEIWDKKRTLKEKFINQPFCSAVLDGRGDNETENRKLPSEYDEPKKICAGEEERIGEEPVDRQYSIKDFFPEDSFFEPAKVSEEPYGYTILYTAEGELEEPSNPCLDYSEFSSKEDDSGTFPIVQRSKKFAWLPDMEEKVLNVIAAEEYDNDSPTMEFDEDEDLEGSLQDEEETRRRVYWSGPGLLQERHVKSLFQSQVIPEGVRPTLAYVSSDEMVEVNHPSSPAVVLVPGTVIKELPVTKKHEERKIKKPLARRVFSTLLKAVGIK